MVTGCSLWACFTCTCSVAAVCSCIVLKRFFTNVCNSLNVFFSCDEEEAHFLTRWDLVNQMITIFSPLRGSVFPRCSGLSTGMKKKKEVPKPAEGEKGSDAVDFRTF